MPNNFIQFHEKIRKYVCKNLTNLEIFIQSIKPTNTYGHRVIIVLCSVAKIGEHVSFYNCSLQSQITAVQLDWRVVTDTKLLKHMYSNQLIFEVLQYMVQKQKVGSDNILKKPDIDQKFRKQIIYRNGLNVTHCIQILTVIYGSPTGTNKKYNSVCWA